MAIGLQVPPIIAVEVDQWVLYSGPGKDGDRVLVQVVTSQSISVTPNCRR
jgi:hypothetical protein